MRTHHSPPTLSHICSGVDGVRRSLNRRHEGVRHNGQHHGTSAFRCNALSTGRSAVDSELTEQSSHINMSQASETVSLVSGATTALNRLLSAPSCQFRVRREAPARHFDRAVPRPPAWRSVAVPVRRPTSISRSLRRQGLGVTGFGEPGVRRSAEPIAKGQEGVMEMRQTPHAPKYRARRASMHHQQDGTAGPTSTTKDQK